MCRVFTHHEEQATKAFSETTEQFLDVKSFLDMKGNNGGKPGKTNSLHAKS